MRKSFPAAFAIAVALFAACVTFTARAQVPAQIASVGFTTGQDNSVRVYFVGLTETLLASGAYRLRWRTKTPLGAWSPSADGKAVDSTAETGLPCSRTVTVNACVYVDTDVLFSAAFQLQVAAVNSAGRGEWSAVEEHTVTGTAATAPPAPATLTAAATDVGGELELTWTAPASGTVTDYRIRWRIADTDAGTTGNQAGNWQGWVSDTTGETSIGDSDDGISAGDVLTYKIALDGGVAYDASVAGVNQSSLGEWISEQTATTRAFSTDATLRTLTVTAGTFDPAFAPATETYRIEVAHAVANLTFTPTPADATAGGVTLNGTAVESGGSSAAALTTGANAVSIVVTAQDATATKTYAINAVRYLNPDVDTAAGDGVHANDGIIIARYLFGVRGVTLLTGQSERSDRAALETQLQAAVDANILDVDNDGASDDQDAIFIARYFLGFRADGLDENNAAAIGARIERFLAE